MTNHDPSTPETAQLGQRVDEIEAKLKRAVSEIDDLLTLATRSGVAQPPDGGTPAPADDMPEPLYATLNDWVDQYFRHVFARSVGGEVRWCAQWDDHPEAATRLGALWRSWETLRLDPNLGIATWLTSYLDPQLTVLLSRSGTFAQCTTERHVACAALGDPPAPRAQT